MNSNGNVLRHRSLLSLRLRKRQTPADISAIGNAFITITDSRGTDAATAAPAPAATSSAESSAPVGPSTAISVDPAAAAKTTAPPPATTTATSLAASVSRPSSTAATMTTTALPTASSSSTAAPLKLPVIIGIVVGGVAFIAIIVGVVFFLRARAAKSRKNALLSHSAMGGGGAGQAGGFQKAGQGDEEFHSHNAGAEGAANGGRNYDGNERSVYGQNEQEKEYYSNGQDKYGSRYLSGGLAGVGGAVGRNANNGRSTSPTEYRSANSPYGNGSPALSSSTTSYPPPSATSSTTLYHEQQQSMYDRQQKQQASGNEGISGQQMSTASPFGAESAGQGKVYTVKRTFEPSLGDELIIYPGDRVQLLISYDDGWALGINLDAQTGAATTKGVFPFDCLEDPAVSHSSSQPMSKAVSASSSTAQQQQQISRVAAPSYALQSSDSFPTSISGSSTLGPLSNLRAGGGQGQGQTTPTIHVSSFGDDEEYRRVEEERSRQRSNEDDQHRAINSSSNGSSSAGGGGVLGGREVHQKKKRISSLIASRDADLFVALGQVNEDQQHQNRPMMQQYYQSGGGGAGERQPVQDREISYPIQQSSSQQQLEQYRRQQQQQFR